MGEPRGDGGEEGRGPGEMVKRAGGMSCPWKLPFGALGRLHGGHRESPLPLVLPMPGLGSWLCPLLGPLGPELGWGGVGWVGASQVRSSPRIKSSAPAVPHFCPV